MRRLPLTVMRTVFPGRKVGCVAFGMPDLAFDVEGGNRYLEAECPRHGWYALPVLRPQWTQEQVAALLDSPDVIGLKPYYSLISANPDTRDEHLEASIFEFLPHHVLEVVNDRRAWITSARAEGRSVGASGQCPRSAGDPPPLSAHQIGDRPSGTLLHRTACPRGPAAVRRRSGAVFRYFRRAQSGVAIALPWSVSVRAAFSMGRTIR